MTRVVVTGAAGFIGSNLIRGLNARGITDIIAVDGDPLTDVSVLTSMDFVMRDGRVYRDEE